MEPESITLSLTLKSNGDLTMTGPLENKMMCFYILELARNFLHTAKPSAIARVPADLLKHLGPTNGKA